MPMPGATVKAFSSPERIAMDSASAVCAESIESAALGPTPDTPMSRSKLRFSLFEAKPKSSKASSLTLSDIKSLARSPLRSCAQGVQAHVHKISNAVAVNDGHPLAELGDFSV